MDADDDRVSQEGQGGTPVLDFRAQEPAVFLDARMNRVDPDLDRSETSVRVYTPSPLSNTLSKDSNRVKISSGIQSTHQNLTNPHQQKDTIKTILQ